MREKHTEFVFNTAHCVSILPQAPLALRCLRFAQRTVPPVPPTKPHAMPAPKPTKRRITKAKRAARSRAGVATAENAKGVGAAAAAGLSALFGRDEEAEAQPKLDPMVKKLDDAAATEASPSPIPSLCTHPIRAGIEWRRCRHAVCMTRPCKEPHHSGQAEP